jgi:pyruvate dehydrogenase E2 component (dihydrolipoamide acetyltransferase)
MATQITLPRLSPGMNEAAVARWLKKAGDEVKAGEALFEVETEKVATEVPSPGEGILSILVPEGKTVPIGTPLAVLAAPGEQVPALEAPESTDAAPAPAAPPAPAPQSAAAPPAPAAQPAATQPAAAAPAAAAPPIATPAADPAAAAGPGRVVASPAARRLAGELGVDLTGLRGSGPGGRIIERDVQAAAASPAPAAPAPLGPEAAPAAPQLAPTAARTLALQGIRRTIADRMLQSQNTNATVTATLEVDMEDATKLRQQLVAEWEQREGVRITFTDLIVKAAAKALVEHPRLNATLRGDQIVEQAEVHVGIAVALDDGLIVPVLRSAERKSLLEIGRETKSLGERARAGRLAIPDVTGGTFTITNLGTYGVDAFTPIINPPEAAILGVGKIARKPVARDDQVVIRPMMWLSLTFDHRIVDGAPAATFLRRVQEILEKPYLLFV